MNEPIRGFIVGACFGALAGLGVFYWVIGQLWLFHGDPIAAGALLFGIIGLLFGDQLKEAIQEHLPGIFSLWN